MSNPHSAEPAGAPPEAGLSRLWRTSSLYLLGNVASRAVGFLAIPFYSRFLTPAEYGLIELIEVSITIVAISFGLQSIGPALTRMFHDQHTDEGECAVISTGVLFTALVSALVAAAAVLASAPLSQAVFRSADEAPLLQAAFAAMFFGSMIEIVLVYERIRERAKFFLAYSLAALVATLALNILFIGFMRTGVWGFVLSKLIVTTAGSSFLTWRLIRDVGWRWRPALIPAFVRFGAPLVLSSLAYFVIHSSNRFFLSASVDLAEVGRYALAYRFAILLSILVGDSFKSSWNVSFFRYTHQDGWQARFASVGMYFAFVLYATGLAVAVFGPELFAVMVPPSYFPPALLLPLLLLALVLREIGDLFQTLLLINRRTVLFSQIAVLGAALNITANILLIPFYGLYGAAAATLLTWGVHMVICCAVAWREHRIPLRDGSFAVMSGLAAAVFAASEAARLEAWLPQVALDGAWVLLFAALCFGFALSAEEQRRVRDAALAGLARVRAARTGLPVRGRR